MVRVFVSYSHADEELRQELDKHLTSLKRQGIVEVWHDRRIVAGEEWGNAIDANLKTGDVILLLVSSDFIASSYCYEVEVTEAMRRHDAGEAIVIPVILRPCDWQALPFGKLQAATKDGRPIKKYPSLDDGFLEVVQSIKAAANRFDKKRGAASSGTPTRSSSRSTIKPEEGATLGVVPRSSNLHIKREFTDHDRDMFRVEAFDYISTFFENSLRELKERNAGLKTNFRRRDANSFEASVYVSGRQATQCGIWLGANPFSGDIAYSNGGLGSGNSFNESLSVADDGQTLGLKPLGLSFHSGTSEKPLLTLEGSAEHFWSMFISPLQHL